MMLVAFFCSTASGQNFLKNEISVVEFNTSWNNENFIKNLDKIKNCKSYVVILCDNIDYMDQFNIKQPTVIIYQNGQEVKRYTTNIMMEFEINSKNLQSDVDEILLSKFN